MEKEKLTQLEEQKTEKKKKTNWFIVGSFRRICMVLLSYILMLIVLCTSFFAASYLYWFGGETAESYWETERFQQKLTSQIRKAAPAIKHYLLNTQDNNEMVEIYTLETENIGNETMVSSWKRTISYTCEAGAEIAGFQTSFQEKESELHTVYQKKNDSFIYFNDFNALDTNFAVRWESQYRNREQGGTQKYCAVSSETMKEWILNKGKSISGNISNDNGNYPKDGYYVICNYHYGKGYSTMLCYDKKKERWYYFNLEEDGEIIERMKFRMPDTVYFPLYGIAEGKEKKKGAGGKKKISIKEFSDGLSAANLYLRNGELASRSYDSWQAAGDEILMESPFFSLKTILYEAGKEYYQKKELLRYIDKKMEGYLWRFTFYNDSDDVITIGFEDGMDTSNMKNLEFFMDFQKEINISEEPYFAALKDIGKQQGYHSMTIKLAIPKSSIKALLFSNIGTIEGQEIRRNLEIFVFSNGSFCGGFAIVSLFCWLYLIIKLLFGKENVICTKTTEGSAAKKKRVFSLERLSIEGSVAIFIIVIFFAYFLTSCISRIQIPIVTIFLLFLDINSNQGAIYLAVAISVIPILLVFCFFSKYIISSISAGSVKE